MLTDSLILIGGMFALGLISRRLALLPDNAADTLNRFVLEICLPALVFQAVSRLQWDSSLLALVILAWALGCLSWLLVWQICRRLGWSREVEGCLVLTVMIGNTAFLGYPMIEGLLGKPALAAAVVYDQLGTFLLLSIGGLSAVSIYSGAPRPTPRTVLLKVLSYPAFIALLLALVPVAHPQWLDLFLDRVAGLLVPVALFAVGLSFTIVPPRQQMPALLTGLGLKMGLPPLLAWAALSAIDAPNVVLAAGVLQSAMPAMVSGGALAMRHGLAPRLAAALVGYGVLVALVWLPFLAWLLPPTAT